MDPIPANVQQKVSAWVPVQPIVKPRPIDLAPSESGSAQTHAFASLTG